MPSQLPLDMLINLAKESTDEAARLLGRLSTERTNAERQLGMLQDYRQDYLERLQQAMTTGMSASDCHNYQRFIGTLDDAIGQQQNVLRQADENLAKGRLYWQQEKRKLNSYDALAQR
ncbi:flagellar export protein FliJ, partial [Achromobacter xylosoxidans]